MGLANLVQQGNRAAALHHDIKKDNIERTFPNPANSFNTG